ncbi:conserved hypothetical protein [Verrucomicrobia bacterium]|nr:conserved hypothetical protein [Verrucomicrobiota bacterium]
MNTITSESNHRLLAQLASVPSCQTGNGEADWFPAVDIIEEAEGYLFKIDLPEVRPEDLRVVVERDGLFISGERPNPWPEETKCLRIERPHGYFERRFALPDDASRVELDSIFKDSVLELRVRKVNPVMQNPVPAQTRSLLKLRSAA